jgi:hypothetical protein
MFSQKKIHGFKARKSFHVYKFLHCIKHNMKKNGKKKRNKPQHETSILGCIKFFHSENVPHIIHLFRMCGELSSCTAGLNIIARKISPIFLGRLAVGLEREALFCHHIFLC